MRLSRRQFLSGSGALLAAPLSGSPLFASVPTGVPLHGLSAFGDLKYGPDFAHFDYVNPDAPKGGLFNFAPPNWQFNQNTQTFNTLNSFVTKGDAPPRMELCFDSLMTSALDEPDSLYGLLAQSVSISEDRNSYEFVLRAEARFHDGSPLTAEDAAFTYKLFRQDSHVALWLPLKELVDAVALDPRRLKLTFSGKQSERAVLYAVTFPVLSKAYLAENPFDAKGLKPLPGSGPYKVGRFAAGQFIEYDRVADYWGKDLPVNRGHHNFDCLRIEFYQERQSGFEAFKKGDILYREEFSARSWANDYDFPALKSGKVVRREFSSEKLPAMQAVALNQRRERFRDVRIREAIGLCFDFEWANANLFYGGYTRSQSCFERSEFEAAGAPDLEELALLEPFRAQLSADAFGEAVLQPRSDGSGRDRKLLSAAVKLFGEAGWKRQGSLLANAAGEHFVLEFLVDDEGIARVFMPWVANLRAIGVDASVRTVDATQYQARQLNFEFDALMMAASGSATPTPDELMPTFHSSAVNLPGSRNLPGTADPVIDALIAAVGKAQDRKNLTIAMRVLDRVLRARRDWLPCYHSTNHRSAYWDMFGFKQPKPDYGFPVETLWWRDKDKASAIGKA